MFHYIVIIRNYIWFKTNVSASSKNNFTKQILKMYFICFPDNTGNNQTMIHVWQLELASS